MSLEDLKKSLSGGAAAPLYFLCGDNGLQIEQAVGMITGALFPLGPAELDLRQFDGQSHGPGEILQAARTQSFFSGKKLVVVRQAQSLKEAQWEQLRGYCKKPSPACCMVFILQLDLSDKKNKGRAEGLKKSGAVFLFPNPKGERQIMQQVKEQLSGLGKTIAPDALAYCGALLDESAQSIAGEVEKLALYCGGRRQVSADDVDAVVCGGGRGTIFNFVDAVGLGNFERALELLAVVLASGTHPLAVLKMIARQFRLIRQSQLMLQQGETGARIAQKLRLPEFVIRGVLQQARIWPAGRMSEIFEEIFQASNLCKSSRADSDLVLEKLLLRLPELRA